MAEVGSAQVAVVPSMRGFRRAVTSEVDAATREASSSATRTMGGGGTEAGNAWSRGFGRAAEGTKAAFRDLGTFAVSTLQTAAVAAAAAIGVALTTGFGRLTRIESAEAKLRGLGNTAEDVEQIMSNALSSVQGTAFGLDEAAAIAASAVAAGVQPGQELEKYLSLTADAATIAGTSLADMGGIINTVRSQGRAYTGDLNQLASRGIPIFEWLADAYGVSSDALREMVSNGEVDAATYERVISEHIGGAALEAGETTAGAWENMKTGLARFGASILESVFPFFGRLFNSITLGLDAVSAKFGPVFDAIGGAVGSKLGPIFDKIDAFFTRMQQGGGISLDLSGMLGPLSALAPVIGGLVGALGPLLSNIPLLGGMFSGLTGPVGIIIGLFTTMFANSAALRDALGGLINTLVGSLGGLMQTLAPVLTNVLGVVAGVLGSLGDVFADVINMIAPLIPQIVSLFASIIPILGPIISLVGEIAGILVGALGAALGAIIPPLVQVASVIIGAVQQAFTALQPAITALMPIISQIATLLGGVLSSVIQAIAPIIAMLAEAFAALLPALMPIVTMVADLIAMFAPFIAQLVGMLAPILQQLSPLFTALLGAIMPILPMLAELISGILPPLISLFTSVLSPIMDLASTILGALMPVIEGLMQILSGLITFVTGVFTGNWGQAWNGIKSMFDGFVNTIRGAVQGLGQIFAAIPQTINSIFAGAGSWLVDSGRAIIQGFINGIKGMIGAVGDAVGGVVSWAKSFFPSSPAERGPFSGSGWRDLSRGGAHVVEEFISGMDEATAAVPTYQVAATYGGASGANTMIAGQPVHLTQNITEANEDPRVAARAWSRELVSQLGGSRA